MWFLRLEDIEGESVFNNDYDCFKYIDIDEYEIKSVGYFCFFGVVFLLKGI